MKPMRCLARALAERPRAPRRDSRKAGEAQEGQEATEVGEVPPVHGDRARHSAGGARALWADSWPQAYTCGSSPGPELPLRPGRQGVRPELPWSPRGGRRRPTLAWPTALDGQVRPLPEPNVEPWPSCSRRLGGQRAWMARSASAAAPWEGSPRSACVLFLCVRDSAWLSPPSAAPRWPGESPPEW